MSQTATTFHEAELVIELTSALHIGSGEADGRSDSGYVRDFNGLPGIPGTAAQGMLRSSLIEWKGKHDPLIARLFGRAGTSNTDNGRGGRVELMGWGVIHGSNNQPVRNRITSTTRDSDPVLRDAAAGMLRDHVCLNARGVVDSRGKFDEIVVNPGHRFTLKLRLVTAPDDPEKHKADDDWKDLLAILADPALRLGGKTRRGLGAFKIVRGTWQQSTDSRTQPEIKQSQTSTLNRNLFHGILSPENLWMVGGGLSADTDSAPVSGTRINWEKVGEDMIEPVWIIPGSSVKGVLEHRTRFYANLHAGNFIDEETDEKKQQVEQQMQRLFGFADGKAAAVGRVLIDDMYLPRQEDHLAPVQNHLHINPFTGGAKEGALFDDQPLTKATGGAELRIQVRQTSSTDQNSLIAADYDLLQTAVNDLCSGRLSLGAHVSRGYGIFTGTPIVLPR